MATHVGPATSRTVGGGRGGAASALPVRVAAIAGAVFFALMVVHAGLRSGAPSATDPGRDVVAYVTRHQGRLQLGAVAIGFAMPAALIWLSGLLRALGGAEGATPAAATVALGGGVLAAASTVTGALVEGTTATRISDLGPAGARVAWTMFLLSTGATLLGLLVLVGVTAIVTLRTHLLARWFGVASLVLALASAVGACTIGYGSDAIQAVAGIAVLLDSVWILLVSIFLWRDPGLASP